MLTIGDFNSFWFFLGHPVEELVKFVELEKSDFSLSNDSLGLINAQNSLLNKLEKLK